MGKWLTNTTILPLEARNTATVIIIHSICAISSIFAWSFRTIVDILSGKFKVRPEMCQRYLYILLYLLHTIYLPDHCLRTYS